VGRTGAGAMIWRHYMADALRCDDEPKKYHPRKFFEKNIPNSLLSVIKVLSLWQQNSATLHADQRTRVELLFYIYVLISMSYDKTNANQVAIDKSVCLLMEQEELSFEEAKELVDKAIGNISALKISALSFLPGIIRWYIDGYVDINDAASCYKVNILLKVLLSTPAADAVSVEFHNEFTDEYLTPDSLKVLLRLDDGADDKPFDFNAADYKLVRVDSWDEIRSYKPLCSDWCIVNSEEAWYAEAFYDSNEVFLAFHKDYKQAPKVPGPEFPNDNYGYSIICIVLAADGSIVSTTSRWNSSIENDRFLSNDQVNSLIKK
jgi:hypothetical protein